MQYSILFPDDKEYFVDLEEVSTNVFKEAIQNILYDQKIKTPRNKPIKIKVKVSKIYIEKYKTKGRFVTELEVDVPLEPMEYPEYEQELKSMMKDLPKEFHQFIENLAHIDGESYETMLSMVADKIDELTVCFKHYVENRLN